MLAELRPRSFANNPAGRHGAGANLEVRRSAACTRWHVRVTCHTEISQNTTTQAYEDNLSVCTNLCRIC